MSLLELPTNPPQQQQPIKLRTSRYGELDEHELIRLLDTIDDERSRARFRESIYISIFIWIAIALFAINYRVIFHQPRLINPADILRQREMTLLNAPPSLSRPAPRRAAAARPDTKTLERLRAAEPPRPAPPPPPITPTPQPTPLPPIATPPPAPQPRPQALPDAPAPSSQHAVNNLPLSPGDAMRGLTDPSLRGRGTGIPTMPGRPGHPDVHAGPEILSDTQGVDFSAYMRRLHDDIERNWYPLIPEEVQAPLLAKGITGIRFIILPNGDIGGVKLETPSGDTALDKAAWSAIVSEGKFPPLPKEFHGPNLELRCGFYYNLQPPNN